LYAFFMPALRFAFESAITYSFDLTTPCSSG
jgi:hypothetical protein